MTADGEGVYIYIYYNSHFYCITFQAHGLEVRT